MLAAHNEKKQELERQGELGDMLADPLIVLGERELNELHRQLFTVVGEGLHDIVAPVNHVKALRRKGQETAL